MKRFFDLLLAVILLVLLAMPMLVIAIIVRFTSNGPVLYWSKRVGVNNVIFKMPKFRSMLVDTPAVASSLMINSEAHISFIGGFLRRYSFDEFPQLFSVIKGDMSFVGPRPALFNQDDLIKLRIHNGVDKLLPGITGWAQINGRDELSIANKVAMDVEYINKQSFWFDLKILCMTFLKVVKGDGISH